MENNIYFISTNDKPVKLIIENQNDTTTKTEKYKKTLYEVLKNELRFNHTLRRNLTKQQIHTENGKLKHGRFNEVINFLIKRGVSKEYIETEVNQERERVVFSTRINIPISNISDNRFGIINLT